MSGFISDSDENDYRDEVIRLGIWCSQNNLALNAKKTKTIIVDFLKFQTAPIASLSINGDVVKIVHNFRYLGAEMFDRLKWNIHMEQNFKKAQHKLYFLGRLISFNIRKDILVTFYCGVIESVLATFIM